MHFIAEEICRIPLITTRKRNRHAHLQNRSWFCLVRTLANLLNAQHWPLMLLSMHARTSGNKCWLLYIFDWWTPILLAARCSGYFSLMSSTDHQICPYHFLLLITVIACYKYLISKQWYIASYVSLHYYLSDLARVNDCQESISAIKESAVHSCIQAITLWLCAHQAFLWPYWNYCNCFQCIYLGPIFIHQVNAILLRSRHILAVISHNRVNNDDLQWISGIYIFHRVRWYKAI